MDKALLQAKELEKNGQIKEAYKEYLRVGSIQDAARLLASSGKPGDAGRLLLSSLKIEPSQVDTLDPSKRKLAYLAATYLAKDQALLGAAVEILVALGEQAKAADLLERSGDMLGAERIRSSRVSLSNHYVDISRTTRGSVVSKNALRLEKEGKLDAAISAYMELKQYSDAARILNSIGRFLEAAKVYAECQMSYEAGDCFIKAKDLEKALEHLVRMQKSDGRYRTGVIKAVKAAGELSVLNFRIEHFVSEFIDSEPENEEEIEAFYLLGELYEKHNLLHNAKEAFTKILAKNPIYRDTSRKLDLLGRYTENSQTVYDQIKNEESSFRGDRLKSIPNPRLKKDKGLLSLPDLPELPPAPKITDLDLPVAQVVEVSNEESDSDMTDSAIEPVDSDQNELSSFFDIGKIINNRYRIDAKLGLGGMAVVFSAFDLELEEEIALKVFLQLIDGKKAREESLARFKQELKLSRQLVHRNIIRLYDIGLFAGYRYISMELLKGQLLEDLLSMPLNSAKSTNYLVQICEGLQTAHDMGVIHRDIKPGNIFVTEDGTVKIMDFGIAKNTAGKGLTMQGMTAGTPEYIAPEQISSFSEVTAAADQYSLGVIAYKMFTGKLLFEHEELMPLLMMHLNRPPKPPREINPAIPTSLEKIILRMIAKKPEERFVSLNEVASHLKQLEKW